MERSSEKEWLTLRELRGKFLHGDCTLLGDYWKSPNQLDLYDRFFAERISWKWQAVLDELTELSIAPSEDHGRTLVDWGCGTGVASRTLLQRYGDRTFDRLILWDRSRGAAQFAEQKTRQSFPNIEIEIKDEIPLGCTLALSHVIGELRPQILDALIERVQRAGMVLWVEPGTSAHSRLLVHVRECMRRALVPIAPCPHREICGLESPENEGHWCHHFAPVPAAVFGDPLWKRFSTELGIDLRSLPVSYLVMIDPKLKWPEREADSRTNRILGRPRNYRGYAKTLVCSSTGVQEEKVLARNDKNLFKTLKDDAFSRGLPPKLN